MDKNQKELNIKKLLKNYSIETTPNIYEKYGGFSDLVAFDNAVYVTYLPNETSSRVIDTAKKLTNEGFDVIPHLPARTMRDIAEIESYIGSLSEEAGCNKILVIGGGPNQKGKITSSLDILKTDLLSKYQFKEVGLAGHPDGNSNISREDLDKAIIEKNEFVKNADYKAYLATQFFFEASSLKIWEQKLYSLNNKLEIHAGIPGPATLKTLVSYAISCGIGNSIKFLSKQAMNITKIATTRTPDKIIADLADYKVKNPYSKLAKLHFFPFGGIKKTSKWLNHLLNSNLDINNNNKFKIIDK